MKVRVQMFGALTDLAAREDVIEVPEQATVANLLSAVRERFPAAAPVLDRVRVAVNEEVVSSEHVVADSDEIALLPPVSGGAHISVRISQDPSADRALRSIPHDAGGTAVFIGTVRANSDAGSVDRLEYSAYDSMAEKVMAEIAQEAIDKWGLAAVAIEHATGVRAVGDVTFVVACSAPHRDEAFDACRYVVDEIKSRVPIWKKESGPWGERWVGL